MSTESSPPLASFQRSTWSLAVVLFGLAFLLAWRATWFIDSELLYLVPYLVLLVLLWVLPQIFLLAYPLATRKQEPYGTIQPPAIRLLYKEGLLAVPIVACCLALVTFVELVIRHLFPGVSLIHEEMEHMRRSSDFTYFYWFAFFAILVAPITEEIFFRGFLFNSFRSRMPLPLAIIVQSAIFGAVHPSLGHSVVAGILGLVLTFVYMWRKTIFAPMLVHGGYNGLSVACMFLAMHQHVDTAALGIAADRSQSECVVASVIPDSPAAEAGIQPGDIITEFGPYSIYSFQDLSNALYWQNPGEVVQIIVDRDGATIQLNVELICVRALRDLTD